MKKKQRVHSIVRIAVQAVFFMFFPALFSISFNGVKYLAERIQGHEVIVGNPFLYTLIALVVFTALFGRFFCGYACAFGSLGDWLFLLGAFVRKKIGAKSLKLPDKLLSVLLWLKYLILVGIIVACLLNVYASVGAADPWGVFASFRAGSFSVDGKMLAAVVLGGIVIGMLLVERFFCLFLCPMGAVFSLPPMVPIFLYNRNREECIPGCSLCIKTCPASISLGGSRSKHGECFQCGKCGAVCPKGNVRQGFRKLKGTEIWLVALKAAALFALCYFFLDV